MYLRFETKVPVGREVEIPILSGAENITPDTVISGVKIDGSDVNLDERVVATFNETVSRINTETLPPKHFRDCTHFVMAMCGLWMPTHTPFSRDYIMAVEGEDNTNIKEHLGPAALGIPNDSRCLGFGHDAFVYSHFVFGVDSSIGKLCFSKLGIHDVYSLSTFDTALADADLEVSHPINRLLVRAVGEEIFQWRRNDT
jgi:hypothetical protein